MKISTILDHVELGQLALPEFQRGYVWGRDQVRGLMNSLYHRYPVGGLLVWTTETDPSMLRGSKPVGSSQSVRLLLDGQQRVTSLYGVMRGGPPAFFAGNERAFTDLYFDLRTETFEFKGVKMKGDPLWVSVTELFDKGVEAMLKHVADAAGENDMATIVEFNNRMARLVDIRDIELHEEQITGRDKTIDEVVEIFNRVNSGGTKLSKGDLALARICADWPGARDEMHRMLGQWQQNGFDFKQELLLRCATAIGTNEAPFSSLKSLSVDEFATALKKSEQSIDFLLNLVGDRLGLDHDRVLAGRYSFAALSRLVAEMGGSISDHHQQQLALYWYIHSFLWGRYSGSTESVLGRDLEALEIAGVEGLIDELDRWRGSLTVRPGDFDSWSIGSRFYPMLYLLTRVYGGKDLGNGMALSHAMLGKSSELHVHHIFPKARLYEVDYARSEVNAVANFCYLTAGSNLSIGASDPVEYLAEVQEAQPGALESQWIPTDPDLWRLDRYLDFLAARRELLADASNEFLATLHAGHQPEPEMPSESTSGQMPPKVGEATDGGPLSADSNSLDFDESAVLMEIVGLADELDLSEPELHYEVTHEDSGEVLAMADLAWPDGVQEGRSEPLAFLVEPDSFIEERLNDLGFRFFTSKQKLVWYLEELLGLDIDGDEVVGEVIEPDDSGDSSDAIAETETSAG